MKENTQQIPWYFQIATIVPMHVILKSIGTMVFISLFFGAYFYVLKAPAYPATIMPITFLDRLIGFQPLALPVYISLWVYVSLPPALLSTRREIYGYGLAMTGTCLTGLIIFYFWPTAAPAAHIDWSLHPSMDFLKNMDTLGNACPSLHVTTAIFSGIWLHHLLRRFGGPQWILIFNWVWCFGIIYSTIATRQHVTVDVVAGLALGVVAAYLSMKSPAMANQYRATNAG